MSAMVLHQSYMTQRYSLFTLIGYYAIVFSFALMSTDNLFIYCAMAFCIASVY